jgi:alpha-mannosidase
MEIYPEYRFSASQPQQYAYLKEDNPAVYARVKAAVAAGTWEPLGGMWVESDCNVVSGESLVRQFLYGQRFFEKEFGKRTDVVWLPDVFGYSAAFPQIIKKAGMKYFMTIKIYWNQFNTPPYQTFDWEGIDGTTVLTHFSPIGGYNSAMTAEEWRKDWTEYKQKHITDSVLYVYGFGDGGGGPTRHMVEAAKRAKSLPGTPEIILSTNNQFFKDLEKQVDGNPALPRWVGELYLEYHRGTYTSQAKNKLANRQSEILLQTAEQTSSLALLNGVGSYPQDELDVAWKLTLLNQFHDIIPGSSIHAVYEDSTLDYVKILATGHKSVKTALASVIERLPAKTGDVLIYNPLSWDRSDVAELPTDVNLPGQKVTTLAGEEKTLVKLDSLPSLGYELVNGSQFTPLTAQDDALKASTTALENKFFTITLDKNAEIESIFDKIANREVIDNSSYCKGNSLLSFEDRPLAFDAWDIDIYYADKMTPIRELDSIKVIEEGPLRASVEIRRHFGADSSVTQRISIYRDIARIDFDTMVDWEERQTLLKAAFPVTIQSARATYDIQFGNVERPTHWNTSWDYARFEVCGHKWADLSEGDYGVSLLSNCKYGWDTKGNVMRLTLLKGAVSPDADADRGRQFFAYSLFPHQGDWRAAETVQRAYEFNVPVKVHKAAGATAASGNLLPTSGSLFSLDAKNLIIETVKKAEDDDQSLIVRLYEAYGQRGRAALTVDRKFKKVMEVNLMEEKTDETRSVDLSIESGVIALNYTPYEIKTLKITF